MKRELKRTDLLAAHCCGECGFWSKPTYKLEAIGPMIEKRGECPDCGSKTELTMGEYEYYPEIVSIFWWRSRRQEYVNFIKKDMESGGVESFREELAFPSDTEGVVLETPMIIKEELLRTYSPTGEDEQIEEAEAGVKLGAMLSEFAVSGSDEVGEQLRAQDREDEGFDKIVEEFFDLGIVEDPLDKHRSCRTHCCIVHGCKYGHRDCPVVLGEVKQEYICEQCDVSEGWTSLLEVEAKVREQQGGMLPYISHENFAKLYPKWETIPTIEDYFPEYATDDTKTYDENREEFFKIYLNIKNHTVLDNLHFIESMKVIYDIHYCKAGVGIVFYYKDDDIGDYRSGLRVRYYYDSFESCITAEAKRIYDTMMSGR